MFQYFKEMNDQRPVCTQCCHEIDTIYNFRQKCLRNKLIFLNYIKQSRSANNTNISIKDEKSKPKGSILKSKLQKPPANQNQLEQGLGPDYYAQESPTKVVIDPEPVEVPEVGQNFKVEEVLVKTEITDHEEVIEEETVDNYLLEETSRTQEESSKYF